MGPGEKGRGGQERGSEVGARVIQKGEPWERARGISEARGEGSGEGRPGERV